jgi:peptidoglycan/xylan/chitin deacetylase (PgdA/CDA1 family)
MRLDAQWKRIARETAARTLHYGGIPAAVRRAHAHGSVAILLYHDPTPDVLGRHLEFLAKRFHFTTLDRVVATLENGEWSAIPERALVITLDDGHRGNHALLPLFRRFEVRPTIYLCSQIVGTSRRFWFQEPISTGPLKQLPNQERLALLKQQTGFEQERAYPDEACQALSREQIREMAPWVDFGSHTRFHPILIQCDEAEAWEEIAGSVRDLEELLERPVRHFAFPNGDYGTRELELVQRAGFASARTTDVGWTGSRSDRFRLPMLGITDDASVSMLSAQLTGFFSYLRRVAQGKLPVAAHAGGLIAGASAVPC